MVTKRTYDKKGRVVKEVLRLGDQIFINKMKYNKKNQVSKVTMSSNLYPEKHITKYKYDKKGNPIEKIENEGKFIIKNEYSKGYLKKTSQHLEGEEGSYENTYKYKKVKVPKSKVKRVEEQQKILILTGHFDLVY